MTSPPTATSFAVLGLLALQPWTAYDLVAQSRRSLHWFWPRSEAHLYAELKRLVARGFAEAEVVEGRRRQSTRYTITTRGREALKDWLATEPAPPSLEIEGLLRLLLADQGTPDDLAAALQATAHHVRQRYADGQVLIKELLTTGGPFPERRHLVSPLASLYAEFLLLLMRWCDETLAELNSWPSTKDVGLTVHGREQLQRVLDEPRI
jgi:PadR family transcriptional regulator, regulatory protein AphA